MNDCIFCKIIEKQISAKVVYEDDYVMAFKDVNPVAKVHVLIVPKVHIESLNELNETNYHILPKIHDAIKKVANLSGLANKGYRIVINCGAEGGQTVPHLHYHLIGGSKLSEKL